MRILIHSNNFIRTNASALAITRFQKMENSNAHSWTSIQQMFIQFCFHYYHTVASDYSLEYVHFIFLLMIWKSTKFPEDKMAKNIRPNPSVPLRKRLNTHNHAYRLLKLPNDRKKRRQRHQRRRKHTYILHISTFEQNHFKCRHDATSAAMHKQ